MDESEKSHLRKLERHSEDAGKLIDYAIRRIDLLLVSVSGAGIYACLEIMKYMAEQSPVLSNLGFKITGLLFATAIIVNFLGQWAAYLSSYYMKMSTDLEIRSVEYKEFTEGKSRKNDRLAHAYSAITTCTNIISTLAMFAGLVSIIISIWIIF